MLVLCFVYLGRDGVYSICVIVLFVRTGVFWDRSFSLSLSLSLSQVTLSLSLSVCLDVHPSLSVCIFV